MQIKYILTKEKRNWRLGRSVFHDILIWRSPESKYIKIKLTDNSTPEPTLNICL